MTVYIWYEKNILSNSSKYGDQNVLYNHIFIFLHMIYFSGLQFLSQDDIVRLLDTPILAHVQSVFGIRKMLETLRISGGTNSSEFGFSKPTMIYTYLYYRNLL